MGFGGSFGGDVFGAGAVPFAVEESGGQPITMVAGGLDDGDYEIHIGPLGTADDPFAVSGRAGTAQGRRIRSRDGILRFYTPILIVGGPYPITIIPWAGGAALVTAGLVTVKRRWFRSVVYDLRRRLARFISAGARRVGLEAEVEPGASELLEAEVRSTGEELTDLAGHRITRLAGAFSARLRLDAGVNTVDLGGGDPTTTIVLTVGEFAAEVVPGMRFRVLSGDGSGDEALILATPTAFSLTLATPVSNPTFGAQPVSWDVVTDPDTEIPVESAVSWDARGEVTIGSTLYRYGSRTDTELREVEHWDGETWLEGARQNHIEGDAVHDSGRKFSAVDRLRKSTQLAHAQDEDLDVLGRNLQVPKPDRGIDRESYRALVGEVAFSSRGHFGVLRRALDAMLGLGGWEMFVDLAGHIRQVFFRRIGAETEPGGRWYMNQVERRPMTAATTVALLESPVGAISAVLAKEGGTRLIAEGAGADSTDGLTVTGPAASFPVRIQRGDTFEVLSGPLTGAAGVIKTRTSATQIVLEGLGAAGGLGGGIEDADWRITRRASVFEYQKPSAEVILDYDGDAGTTVWTFVGTAEAVDVTQIADGGGIEFLAPGAGSAYYTRYTRVTAGGFAAVEMTFSPVSGFSGVDANAKQFSLWLEDTARRIIVGCVLRGGVIHLSFVDGLTGEFLGGGGDGAVTVAYGAWITVRVEKTGAGTVRLYADGLLVEEAVYTDFQAAAAIPGLVSFGCQEPAVSGQVAQVRQVDYLFESDDDYLLLPLAAGSTTATDRLLHGSNPFVAGDVGDVLLVTAAPTANGSGGTARGEWVVAELVAAGEVRAVGRSFARGRVSNDGGGFFRFDAGEPWAFRWPDSLGAQVQITAGPNIGSYVILDVNDPISGDSYGAMAQPPEAGYSSRVTLATEGNQEDAEPVAWSLVPAFPTSGADTDFYLTGRGSVAADVVTLARAVPLYAGGYVPVLEVTYWLERSGFVMGDGLVGPVEAAYLVDTFGWVADVLLDLMAVGYKAVFDRLFRDDAGPHVIDP